MLTENQYDKDGTTQNTENNTDADMQQVTPKKKKNQHLLYNKNKKSKDDSNKDKEKEFSDDSLPGPVIVPDLKQNLQYMSRNTASHQRDMYCASSAS